MNAFKTWLEQEIGLEDSHLSSEKEDKVKRIWDAILDKLGGEFEDASDVLKKPLNHMKREPGTTAGQAIMTSVGGFLQQLGEIPQYSGGVKDALSWLGEEQPDNGLRKDKDVLGLLTKAFGGEETVQKLLNHKDLSQDEEQGKLQKTQPVPPLDSGQDMQLDEPDQPQPNPNDPNASMVPQQPQVPPPNPMMKPSNPMPPVGAHMGLY